MLIRLGTPVMTGVAALLLALALTGTAVGVALVADTVTPTEEVVTPEAPDTTATFEDIDGDGIDDDCQAVPAVLNQAAADAAALAVDLNADGKISKSEAARSNRIGGKNCNHGGYVSSVAKGEDENTDEDADEDTPAECPAAEAPAAEEPVAPTVEEPATEPAPNAHGKAVSGVAQSGAVGGKNCNHGGAVSEKAKGDHATKAEKAAAKAAAKAAREAAKAARQLAKGQ
jgi:hypothetical protein